jgi:hypothetical protein
MLPSQYSFMNTRRENTPESVDLSDSAQDTWAENRYVLKFAAIHADCLPWEWTTHLYRRAVRLVGQHAVHIDCWTVEALNQPPALQHAVEAAIEADILVVAVCASRELPLNLYRWLDSWLPNRPHRTGALAAILGVPPQPSEYPARIREYLHDVARLADLDFLPQERPLPLENSGVAGESIAEGPQGIMPVVSQTPPRSLLSASARGVAA